MAANLLYSAYAGSHIWRCKLQRAKPNLKIDGKMLGIVDWLWGYLAIAAMGMTIIYFLFEVNQKNCLWKGHDVTMKTWIVCFGKLFTCSGNLFKYSQNLQCGYWNT